MKVFGVSLLIGLPVGLAGICLGNELAAMAGLIGPMVVAIISIGIALIKDND